jgi:hypothetical protein
VQWRPATAAHHQASKGGLPANRGIMSSGPGCR